MQLFFQLILIHVVLVLSDTDGFRLNFNKLGERILESSCHRGRASLSRVKVRKLLCCQFTCRVHRGTGFIHNDILHFALCSLEIIADDFLRFPGCGTVSQGDEVYLVFFNQTVNGIHRFFDLIFRCGWVNDSGIQDFSGRVHYGNFTAGTKSGVPAEHHFSYNGRLHEKLLQIVRENGDGAVFRFLRKPCPNFIFNRRRNKSLVAVLDGFQKELSLLDGKSLSSPLFHVVQNLFFREKELYRKNLFFFPAVDGENAIAGNRF